MAIANFPAPHISLISTVFALQANHQPTPPPHLLLLGYFMKLFPEDIIQRLYNTRRSVSRSRQPSRRSIYEGQSPSGDENQECGPGLAAGSQPTLKKKASSKNFRPASSEVNTLKVRSQRRSNCQLATDETPSQVLEQNSSASSSSTDSKPAPANRRDVVNRSITPSHAPRSSSVMSHVSFRSFRSINSRVKVKLRSFGQVLDKPHIREFDWPSLRAEYELHLARGSIIERCLVEVELGGSQTEHGKWWLDTVWTLADRLSPPLPAALVEYSANGLIPLLVPLRQSLDVLAIQLPYDYRLDAHRFQQLARTLNRALWYAKLIEGVIELVSRAGLVKFELIGLGLITEQEAERITDDEALNRTSAWTGEMRGKTGGGNQWSGVLKV